MMRYLVVDSAAGSFVAVVLAEQGKLLLENELYNASTREHVESLAPFVRDVIGADKRLDAVIVSTGPAPFTGLRAGIMTAQVVSYVQAIPLYGVGTIDHLAAQVYRSGVVDKTQNVAVMTDARRKEVYFAVYKAAEADVEILLAPQVAKPDMAVGQVENLGCPVTVIGAGADLYLTDCELPRNLYHLQGSVLGTLARPDALAMVEMVQRRLEKQANGVEVDLAVLPKYLRRPDVFAGVGGK